MFFNKILSVLGVLMYFCSGVSADTLPDGKWELTAKVEVTGLPLKVPDQTATMCVDNKNNPDPNKPPIAAPKSCVFSDYKVSGKTISWAMECSGQLNLKGRGELTFTETDYSGRSSVDIKMPGLGSIKANQTYTGKRLGAC